MKRKKKESRLGLLQRRRSLEQEAAAADTRKREPETVEVPVLQPEIDPKAVPGKEPFKKWREGCFFSCISAGWEPVDSYVYASIAHLAKAVPLATVDVPKGRVFRFHKFGVGWSVGGQGSLQFRVSVDGDPIGIGLAAFTHEAGALNVADMFEAEYTVEGPATVAVECYNSHATTDYTGYGRIIGYLGPNK